MPNTQQYHECVQINDKIYAIGDWYPNVSPARKSTGQVQIYDLAAEAWVNNTTSMPPSMEVGNFGMASIGNKIYVAGGVQNSSANDATDRLLEYDTVTGIWTELANMTEKRFAFPLVEYHGLLYAFGGLQGPYTWSTQPVINTSEVYDPSTNTWTKLPNMSFHRFGMAASVHNDEIVLIGGHSQSASVKDTWGYVPHQTNGESKMICPSASLTLQPSMRMESPSSLEAIFPRSPTAMAGAFSTLMKQKLPLESKITRDGFLHRSTILRLQNMAQRP